MNENRKLTPSLVLIHILLIILVVINLFPLYWMMTFSLKDNDEIFGGYLKDSSGAVVLDENGDKIPVERNMIGLPRTWRWNNYPKALNTGNMGRYFLNSLIVAVAAIAITLIAAFMATYAMTRLVWKGRKAMNKFFMLGLTIPIHAALVPVFMILSRLKLLDTYIALIVPYAAFSLSMGILISIGFMGDIPYDLDEAAFLDGCGVWGIFGRVIAPLMIPATSTVGIYTFLQCWNELLFATIFVSKGQYKTLPVGVQQLFGQYTTDWGPIGAALAIATIPTMIVYILLSKRIQAGFIAGAVKGRAFSWFFNSRSRNASGFFMPVKGIPAGAAGPEPEADFRNPGRIPGKLFEQGRNHYILWLIFYPGEKRALDSDEIIT